MSEAAPMIPGLDCGTLLTESGAPEPVYRRPDAVALLLGVQVGTLRQWARRGHISATVGGCYDLAEALRYSDERDAHPGRFGQALGGRRRRGEARRVACVSSQNL